MKRRWLALAALLPLLLNFGCSSLSHTENGALAGGGGGALVGAAIGSATGHAGAGALIGGAAGALGGALVGNSMDNSERKAEARAAQARAIALTDVVQMTHDHISDTVIITQIRTSGSVFNLSGAEITWLKQNGVSDPVIMEMQATAHYPRRYYSAQPVYGDAVYVVDPPPPVHVGIGFGYGHYGHRW